MEYSKLRELLKGELQGIAKEAGVHPSTVTRVLKKEGPQNAQSRKILKLCVERAEAITQESKQITERIEQLSDG